MLSRTTRNIASQLYKRNFITANIKKTSILDKKTISKEIEKESKVFFTDKKSIDLHNEYKNYLIQENAKLDQLIEKKVRANTPYFTEH